MFGCTKSEPNKIGGWMSIKNHRPNPSLFSLYIYTQLIKVVSSNNTLVLKHGG